MNFRLVTMALLLSLPVLSAQIIQDADTNKIFRVFGVEGLAFTGSCTKFGEHVYLCSSHVVDNKNLWREFNQRKERANKSSDTPIKEVRKSAGPFRTCLILTFAQEKTVILESAENGYVGKKVLGIQPIKQIAYSQDEKYSILAFTEDASKLSLSLPEFHDFPHRLAFSNVIDWKIYFSMANSLGLITPEQMVMKFEQIFVHASKHTNTLLIHKSKIPAVMAGGLIWTPENKLVGIMVANLETWKETHSFDLGDATILQEASNSYNFGFTPSKEPNLFDIELKDVALGQIITKSDIIQAYKEYE